MLITKILIKNFLLANFGMLVKNCIVSDGGSSTELVLDERG